MSQEDIDAMFHYADVDGDGRISWQEFQTMINPPRPPEPPKPRLTDLVCKNKTSAEVASAPVQPLSVGHETSETVSTNDAQCSSWSSVVRGTST